MKTHTLFWPTLRPVAIAVVAMLACQQMAMASQSTTVKKSIVVGKSTSERQAVTQPKIAVTDLSYDEVIKEHFESYEYSGKHNSNSSSRSSNKDSDDSSSDSSSDHHRASGEESVKYESGYQTTIDRGELRKFTADVKGELLKSGYKLVQGKPWTQKETEKLYDIIERIKQGDFAGADYVLFGSINNVNFSRNDTPIQGSNAFSHMLSLNLMVEFSLINTRSYEIKAAFSAMGEGSDMKMSNAPGTSLSLNRGKVMQDVSRSLGSAVAQEVQAQFSDSSSETVIEEKETVLSQ